MKYGVFVRTKHGMTLKLGSDGELVEAVADYGDSGTPTYHNFLWNGKGVQPFCRWLFAADKKWYRIPLEDVYAQVYDPSLPEYQRQP